MKQLVFARALLLGSLPFVATPAFAQQSITVDQIFHQGNLQVLPPTDITWSPDGTQLSYTAQNGDLMAAKAVSGAQRVLVSREKLHAFSGTEISERDRDHRARYDQPNYIWVPDSKHLLFDFNGELWFFDTTNGTGLQLGSTDMGSGDDPQFSPDGAYLSYLRGHNLYVRKMNESQNAVRLTDSSNPAILNGEVDWVYLEELDARSNYFWSPDSKHLAYLQTNETQVPEYPIVDWIPLHATEYRQRYPQPGDLNPAVRLGVVGPNGGKTKWINLPIDSGNDYIPRFGWIDGKALWIEALARDHTKKTIYIADIGNDTVEPALTLSDDKFFDESYDIEVSGADMLLTSWQDGHNHIYLYHLDSGKATLVKQLTAGDWEVSKICAIDLKSELVYYLSNEGDPTKSLLWAVKLDGTGKHMVSTSGGWHDPVFSPNAKFFVDTISSLTTPPGVDLCSGERDCQTIWKSPAVDLKLIDPISLDLKASDNKTALNGRLLLPPGMTQAQSIPLIVNPYGGPHNQLVIDKWDERTLLFDQVLAQHGFAVLHVDNRGMGGRGRDFAQAAYRNFGPMQLGDQLAALDQVLARYPQLDAHRLGWWGWSWGGTFTLYALTHSDRFRAGVAVAPVTDWRNYDSIYTERYMGEPESNPDEYHNDSVINSVAALKGRLLLAHGTGDDNVHLGNSIQFIQQLIDANIPYDLQLYPRKTHSISGPSTRTHLYTRILAHFEQYLKPASSETHTDTSSSAVQGNGRPGNLEPNGGPKQTWEQAKPSPAVQARAGEPAAALPSRNSRQQITHQVSNQGSDAR